MNHSKITIDRKVMEQAEALGRVKNGDISQKEAARLLGWTERWVRTKLRRYRAKGAEGLVHGNTGKPSGLKFPAASERLAIELLRGPYQGFGPTFTAEKLFEQHGIKVSEEAMRKIMIAHGLWTVKGSRPKHRRRRIRRACFGMMIQLDGSPHDWFEGCGSFAEFVFYIQKLYANKSDAS